MLESDLKSQYQYVRSFMGKKTIDVHGSHDSVPLTTSEEGRIAIMQATHLLNEGSRFQHLARRVVLATQLMIEEGKIPATIFDYTTLGRLLKHSAQTGEPAESLVYSLQHLGAEREILPLKKRSTDGQLLLGLRLDYPHTIHGSKEDQEFELIRLHSLSLELASKSGLVKKELSQEWRYKVEGRMFGLSGVQTDLEGNYSTRFILASTDPEARTAVGFAVYAHKIDKSSQLITPQGLQSWK